MKSNDQITRHSKVDRISHWVIASSGILLAFSGIGFMPLYGRFYLNEVPGMQWVSDFNTQMNLHYLSAFFFVSACIFHLIYHWRLGNFALFPRKGDVVESVLIIKAILWKNDEPPHDKFLAEQRLAYALFSFNIAILVVSGYILSVKNTSSVFINPDLLQAIIIVHLVFTFIFIFQILLHLAAFSLKTNRPLLRSMFNGKVNKAYAEQRHPIWLKRKTNKHSDEGAR